MIKPQKSYPAAQMMEVIVDGAKTYREIDYMESNDAGFLEPHPKLKDNERIQKTIAGEIHIFKV